MIARLPERKLKGQKTYASTARDYSMTIGARCKGHACGPALSCYHNAAMEGKKIRCETEKFADTAPVGWTV
jgi:hypothetical protein